MAEFLIVRKIIKHMTSKIVSKQSTPFHRLNALNRLLYILENETNSTEKEIEDVIIDIVWNVL